MRSLLLNANKFEVKVVEKSTRPFGIEPENKNSDEEKMGNGLVVLFCVEKGDSIEQVRSLYQEITKAAEDFGAENVMIAPFVHLSSNIADPEEAKELYLKLIGLFADSKLKVQTSHFGYHKSLLLDIKGHPGSFRYREFTCSLRTMSPKLEKDLFEVEKDITEGRNLSPEFDNSKEALGWLKKEQAGE